MTIVFPSERTCAVPEPALFVAVYGKTVATMPVLALKATKTPVVPPAKRHTRHALRLGRGVVVAVGETGQSVASSDAEQQGRTDGARGGQTDDAGGGAGRDISASGIESDDGADGVAVMREEKPGGIGSEQTARTNQRNGRTQVRRPRRAEFVGGPGGNLRDRPRCERNSANLRESRVSHKGYRASVGRPARPQFGDASGGNLVRRPPSRCRDGENLRNVAGIGGIVGDKDAIGRPRGI